MRLLAVVGLITVLTGGCAIGRGEPDWVRGKSRDYPVERFLTGLGMANSKEAAVERAYAAVAKVFKAEVNAQSRDWESFLLLEQKGQANTERRLTLDQITRVSTDKVLENVRVLESWRDAKTGQEYALAGMDRNQAGAALLERISDLDRTVETELRESKDTQDKLLRVRNLRRAIKNLVLREAYNADLRIIRTSGAGDAAPHRVADLTAELESFLGANIVVGVEVAGEQADITRRAVMEGLLREGLPVTARAIGSESASNGDAKPVELLVKGTVGLWDVSMPDPRFRYARWCSDFVVTERGSQRIVGAVSIGGREGHVNMPEARAKAVRVMQQELTSNLARTLAAYVYGESDPPANLPPASCPQEHPAR